MNTQKGRAKFKKFRILLDSGYSSTLVTRRLITELKPKEDSGMQWTTQASNITTNLKVKIYLTLPELSSKKIVTWNCPVDDSAEGRYDMILGRYLLTALGLNIEFYDDVIGVDGIPLKGSMEPMVDMVQI